MLDFQKFVGSGLLTPVADPRGGQSGHGPPIQFGYEVWPPLLWSLAPPALEINRAGKLRQLPPLCRGTEIRPPPNSIPRSATAWPVQPVQWLHLCSWWRSGPSRPIGFIVFFIYGLILTIKMSIILRQEGIQSPKTRSITHGWTIAWWWLVQCHQRLGCLPRGKP